MNDILINILSVVISAIILPLISLLGAKLISFLNKKIKNADANRYFEMAVTIVMNAVRTVFQTYVDNLKRAGTFDLSAQRQALLNAKNIALSQMSVDVKKFIMDNYGDIDRWISNQIEASINILKNE